MYNSKAGIMARQALWVTKHSGTYDTMTRKG